MSQDILIEACVGSVESAIAAQMGGVSRVELCDNLLEGGTTPSLGAIEIALKRLQVDVNVIIRPRGGDFLYSGVELEIMRRDVQRVLEFGANGIVSGALTPEGRIDIPVMRMLKQAAGDLSFTCHRAFDMVADPLEALEELIDLGIDRILTSGHRPSAVEGLGLLSLLVERAAGRIIIMPGVGIDQHNLPDLIERTGAREYHVYAPIQVPSAMQYRNEKVFMGSDPDASEYEISTTDETQVRAICDVARNATIPL
ncbi:MAG: copper homeostasis protein CutC [bacterium]|nr:copper homeostasis protein CutC [bacterium]